MAARGSTRGRRTDGSGDDGQARVRWLDADEQVVFLTFMSTVAQLLRGIDEQLGRDAGLSHYEYLVMASLSMAPERTLRMSEVAEFTDSTLSRLSNVATRLEKRGWLRRSPDPTDGRYTLATLTDEGMATVEAAAPGHVTEVRRLLIDPLPAGKQRQLYDICRRILETIDPARPLPAERVARLRSATS